MLLNLVELLNLTFAHELGSNRDSNVKFAPLAAGRAPQAALRRSSRSSLLVDIASAPSALAGHSARGRSR